MTIPVLLITFNRPDQTRQVLSAIQKYSPEELYVFQDGARDGYREDKGRCAGVRQAIDEMVNWPCTLHKRYSEKNLGCGPGPASAITWFFQTCDQGIIIEDDAVPHPDFFGYATELLSKYRDNEKVMAIGSMQLESKRYGDGSYYFSRMNHTLCAWATWKRAWDHFDIELKDFSRRDLSKVLRAYGCGLREREYWCARLDEIHKDGLHGSSWDQQFWMSIWRYGGKGILPNVNLCSNIGFCPDATHTWNSKSPASAKRTFSILPLKDPSDTKIQKKADDDFQKIYFDPHSYGKEGFRRFPYRMNRRIKRMLHHKGPWLKKSHKIQ